MKKKMIQKTRPAKAILFIDFAFLLLAACFFFMVLVPREIPLLKTLGVLARYNTTRFLPALIILLLFSFLFKRPYVSSIYSWAAILLLFSLSLIGLWASAYSETYVIAGLVPRSDAFFQYAGALNLLLRGRLNGFTSRRPLFGSFLAFLLWINGGNLQLALTFLAFLTAAACYFAFRQVQSVLRPTGSILFFAIQFLFIRRFIGLTMSEDLGFILGTISIAIWLYALAANRDNSRKGLFYFQIGVFVYALAQMARPAAVATLPLLAIFSGFNWRDGRKFSLKPAMLTLGVIILGLLANSLIYSIAAVQSTAQMNNFGYGIYGLAAGGKGWKQIFFDHPEVYSFTPENRGNEITKIVINQLVQHPGLYLKGLAVQAQILLSFQPTNSLFSFVTSSNPQVNFLLIASLMLLMVAGLVELFQRVKEPVFALMLILFAGLFLSLTISPAYQTQYMRVFAASIPVLAVTAGIGMGRLIVETQKRSKVFSRFNIHNSFSSDPSLPVYGAVLAALILLSPFAVKLARMPSLLSGEGCGSGQHEAVFLSFPGTKITIFENTPDQMTWVPYVSRFDYQKDIHSICCDEDIAYLKYFPGGTEIFPTINLLDGNQMVVIQNMGGLPDPGLFTRACGRMEDIYRNPSDRGFYYPQEVEIINP